MHNGCAAPLSVIMPLIACLIAAALPFAMRAAAAQEDPPFKVKLPFPPDTQYKITQGNFGRFSHNNDEFMYAWDFDLPEGSSVTAAAAGRIADIKQDGKVGGGSRMFAASTNYVLIDHGHGHFTRYMHLKYNGVKVKIGEVVRAGQEIALSGSTGFATSAHLHFQACDFRGAAMPSCFIDFPLRAGVPLTGDTCRSCAVPETMKEFETSSTLPANAFAKNGIQLSEPLPACIYEEGQSYRIKGRATDAERGSKIALFVMPLGSFETQQKFEGEVAADGTFDFPARFKLSRAGLPKGKTCEQSFRMTLVTVDPFGSFQSEVNTPMTIAEKTERTDRVENSAPEPVVAEISTALPMPAQVVRPAAQFSLFPKP